MDRFKFRTVNKKSKIKNTSENDVRQLSQKIPTLD